MCKFPLTSRTHSSTWINIASEVYRPKPANEIPEPTVTSKTDVLVVGSIAIDLSCDATTAVQLSTSNPPASASPRWRRQQRRHSSALHRRNDKAHLRRWQGLERRLGPAEHQNEGNGPDGHQAGRWLQHGAIRGVQ